MGNKLAFFLLAGVIALTLWFNTPAPALPDGSTAAPTSSHFHLLRTGTEVDAVLRLRDPAGAAVGTWYLDRGGVFQPPELTGGNALVGPKLTLDVERHWYFLDPGFDVGTWSAYNPHATGDVSGFQAGLRLSPLRLAYGTVAADAIISAEGAGAGLSVYPPSLRLGSWWRHWGLGTWYFAPFDGSSAGWVVGLSFTTRD